MFQTTGLCGFLTASRANGNQWRQGNSVTSIQSRGARCLELHSTCIRQVPHAVTVHIKQEQFKSLFSRSALNEP